MIVKPPDSMTWPVLIVAGEASSDYHAAKIVRKLKQQEVPSFGMGGPHMRAEGFDAVVRAEDLSVMGLIEVLRHLPRILQRAHHLRQEIRRRLPKIALLIDLPDFNLRMAKFLKSHGIYVIYYISPQLWAWRSKRVQQVKRYTDEMLCILPFEAEFYENHHVAARYIGHPLVEDLKEISWAKQKSPNEPVFALLPGSRRQESLRLLPPLLAAAALVLKKIPTARFVLPIAGTTTRDEVNRAVNAFGEVQPRLEIVMGDSQRVLAHATGAVVASGTATLEAALIGVPFVAVYKISWLSFAILKRIVKAASVVKVTSVILANLILGRRVIEEYLQEQVTPERIAQSLLNAVTDSSVSHAQKVRQELLCTLGVENSPTQEVTAAIMKRLELPS